MKLVSAVPGGAEERKGPLSYPSDAVRVLAATGRRLLGCRSEAKQETGRSPGRAHADPSIPRRWKGRRLSGMESHPCSVTVSTCTAVLGLSSYPGNGDESDAHRTGPLMKR